jgi:hypothetical protein
MTVTVSPVSAPGQELLEELVDQRVSTNPLARSRMLRWLGAGVFGVAVTAALPRGARADVAVISSTCGTTLSPCYGYPLCPYGCIGCCRNDINFCDPHCNGGYLGCPSGNVCWYSCVSHRLHKCCDCRSSRACICHFILGSC